MKCQVHKYKRVKLDRNKNPVYKCINCPHYIIEPLVLGREAICWVCGNVFTMNQNSLLLKPHCGCKTKLESVRVSQGAAMNDTKNKILKAGIPETEENGSDSKSDMLDLLLSKLKN